MERLKEKILEHKNRLESKAWVQEARAKVVATLCRLQVSLAVDLERVMPDLARKLRENSDPKEVERIRSRNQQVRRDQRKFLG